MDYTILDEIIGALSRDEISLEGFLERWVKVPYFAFCEDDGRILLGELRGLLFGRFPSLIERTAYTDPFLSQERLNYILWEAAQNEDLAFSYFLADLQWLEDFSFSEQFCHRLTSLLMFLIQFKYYPWVTEILKAAPWLGTFADCVDEERLCICSYAIERIEKEEDLIPILDAIAPSFMDELFMIRETPAATAVRTGRRSVLKYLFDRGLCSEKYALNDKTVLQYATAAADLGLMEFALSQLHHDPNCVGLWKQTPLMIAAEKDDPETAKLLLAHGADVNATDAQGRTAMYYCKSHQMRALLACPRNLGAEVLSKAIRAAKNGPVSKDLLDAVIKLSPETLTYQGSNLAVISAHNGHVENLARLLSHYDLSDMAEELACAAFHTAVPLFKPVSLLIQLADTMIDAGIKVHVDSIKMFHPFTELADLPEIFDPVRIEDAYKLFNKVKDLGFDPLATMYTGTNLLYFAIQGMNIPLIQYCMDQGLSLMDLENTEGAATVLLTRLPLSKEPGFNQTHREADVWELCRTAGCDINHQDSRGETALHALTRVSWVTPEMVNVALSLGIDPSIPNNDGRTAAQLAFDRGCPEDVIAALNENQNDNRR